MKISEKQLLMLVDIAKDTLRIGFGNEGVIFGGYDHRTRAQLVNDIMNQQSNELRDVELEKPVFPSNTFHREGQWKSGGAEC